MFFLTPKTQTRMSMWTSLFGSDQAKKKKKTTTSRNDDRDDDVREEAPKPKKFKPRKKRSLPVALNAGQSATRQRQKRRRPNPVRYLYV